MTSARATTANRRNARASTGPRTEAGKARAGQNARKPGLAIRQAASDVAPGTEQFAERIAGDFDGDPAILVAARVVAEAHSHLRQVRAVKHSLMRGCGLNPAVGASPDTTVTPLAAAADGLARLERLDRYERRAFSRRKFAIRQFEELIEQARGECLEVKP